MIKIRKMMDNFQTWALGLGCDENGRSFVGRCSRTNNLQVPNKIVNVLLLSGKNPKSPCNLVIEEFELS